MCRPDHFQVSYNINPWMNLGSVDPKKAKRQWEELLLVLKSLGVRVHVLMADPSLPDMVFTRDLGVMSCDGIILGSFAHSERQGETAHFVDWCNANNVPIFYPDNITVEGGDCLQTHSHLFVGIGMRTSATAATHLRRLMNKIVVSLELVDPYFFHLDTCFFPLDDTRAFYYPRAFSSTSCELLRTIFSDLMELTEAEAKSFCANSLVIGKKVLVQQGNPSFMKKLETLGYKTIELDLSEFNKSGGGIHCLTLEIS